VVNPEAPQEKTRYKIARKSTTKILALTPTTVPVKHGIDAALAVISHHQATKLKSCFGKPSVS
jgi:hypothetical protein